MGVEAILINIQGMRKIIEINPFSHYDRGRAVAWWLTVLTPRTPDPEVGESSPTMVAVLCP